LPFTAEKHIGIYREKGRLTNTHFKITLQHISKFSRIGVALLCSDLCGKGSGSKENITLEG
jgi:hypothetical protein